MPSFGLYFGVYLCRFDVNKPVCDGARQNDLMFIIFFDFSPCFLHPPPIDYSVNAKFVCVQVYMPVWSIELPLPLAVNVI